MLWSWFKRLFARRAHVARGGRGGKNGAGGAGGIVIVRNGKVTYKKDAE